MTSLNEEQKYKAMRVRLTRFRVPKNHRLTKDVVLVALLHLLLPRHDHLEDVHWTFPPPSDDQESSQMDHLLRDGDNGLDWPCLLLRHTPAMHADQLLLDTVHVECARERILRRHQYHHRAYIPLLSLRHHFGLHIRHPSVLPNLELEHATQGKNNAHSCPGYGLHVSGLKTGNRFGTLLTMRHSASIAVTVRLAYVMDFRNPDFLYATVDVAIWSDIEQGLAITAGSLATLRPLYRQLASRMGFSTGIPEVDSRPTGMRTPQWSPPSTGPRKNFLSVKSLLRSEKGTMRSHDDEYGMGDLQPVRLRDDVIAPSESEKSDKSFTTWAVHATKRSDEECRAGEITRQTQVHQATEWRR